MTDILPAPCTSASSNDCGDLLSDTRTQVRYSGAPARMVMVCTTQDTMRNTPAKNTGGAILARVFSERTLAGLARAKRQGKTLGRPKLVVDRDKIRKMRAGGMSFGKIADEMGLPKTTVARIAG